MDERRALVLANGDLVEAAVLRRRLDAFEADLVVAADGGARHAAALGLTLDLVVGDFDSLSPSERDGLAQAGIALRPHPAGKDETDLELALLEAQQAGATRIVALGTVGGRLDMTLANVGLLLHPALRRLSIQYWIGAETAYLLVPPGGPILGQPGDRVSLLPLGGEARGVTTRGLVFPLISESLPVGPARGVSNRVSQAGARVELASGALLVIHTPSLEIPGSLGPPGVLQGGSHGT